MDNSFRTLDSRVDNKREWITMNNSWVGNRYHIQYFLLLKNITITKNWKTEELPPHIWGCFGWIHSFSAVKISEFKKFVLYYFRSFLMFLHVMCTFGALKILRLKTNTFIQIVPKYGLVTLHSLRERYDYREKLTNDVFWEFQNIAIFNAFFNALRAKSYQKIVR